MRIRGNYLLSSMFVIAVLLTGSCDDGNGVTDPIVDVEAPSVVLTAAPATGELDHELSLSFTVTDDVALEVVTIDWGIDDAPVESIPLEGKAYSGSCAHTFAEPGEYMIVVEVIDASGRRASANHEVSIAQPPPGAPTNVSVAVSDNRATVSWTPGGWGSGQEIVVSRLDAAEPDRVVILSHVDAYVYFPNLGWAASYSVVVTTINPVGRAESAPVTFQVPAPEPPVLTRFSAAWDDPTCLVLAWDPAEAAENYRVVVTGEAAGDSFEQPLPAAATEVELCAATYPIVDGMTYSAQVVSLLGGREYGSNWLEWTVDFNPPFTATGAWTGTGWSPMPAPIRLDLLLDEDASGAITGWWTEFDLDGEPLGSGPVSGTRVWGAIELTLGDFVFPGPPTLTGEFIDEDTVEGILDFGLFEVPITLSRVSIFGE